MRRWPWIALLAGVLLLAATHFAIWRYEVGQLDAGFAGWLAARRAEGWHASTATPEPGGLPMAATLTVPDLRLEGGEPEIPHGLAWRAERLELRVDLFSPATLVVNATGAQHLRVGAAPDIAFTAESMVAQLPLTAGVPPDTVSVTARALRAGLGAVGSPDSVTVELAQLDGAIASPTARSWRLSAEAIALPADRGWALGNRISSLSTEGALNGPLPPADSPTALATAWRDGGGKFEIRRLAMGWGPLGLSGNATLALDQRLQPAGTGSVRVIGHAAALDALVSGRVLTPGAGLAAKAVLSLLAGPPAEGGSQGGSQGGPPAVEVPLTLQDRTLSMRQAPLVRVPEIIWPAP